MFNVLFIIGALVIAEILALLWLRHTVDSYRDFWENQNNTSQGKVNYIALGDSTAQGIGATRAEKSYVGLLAKQLNANVVNLSVSGAKVANVTKHQLPRLASYSVTPQTTITLAIGANDMGNFNAAAFERQLDELFGQLPPQTIVADVPFFGGGRLRRLEPKITEANAIVHHLAEKHGLKLAELHKITEEKDSLLVYAVDWFHPSNTGYKNWYEAFRQALNL